MYSLSGRPPDVRSTPNSGPIADILRRSRRWANTDREFTFADYRRDADYHPDEPGASQGGRALFVDNFDGPAQPKAASLRKILPPTSCHQTVGGFYYILFVARSLGSSCQRYHPNNCSYAWPRHSCNHFYSSKLADASQFTSLGAGL